MAAAMDRVTAAMNILFVDITDEARSRSPTAHFSHSVRARLERYPKRVRADIVARPHSKSAPLFYACAKGKLEMVEYLISTCAADPDQKGWWYGKHCGSCQMVPPLWCATVLRKFPIVKCLISHGCQVDALSDNQMTALEAFCVMKTAKHDIAEYLLKHGAKVPEKFYYGRTCLMHAVRNAKLCRLLLEYGADVKVMDKEQRTALHYAIESGRIETVKLLLENDADPDLRSQQGDDALQAAVLYGGPRSAGMIQALTKHKSEIDESYPFERLANMYELWGSRIYLESPDDEQMTFEHWRWATKIRNSKTVDGKPLAKKPPEENLKPDSMKKRLCYGNASEFTSLAELDAMAGNWRAITIQCILINERILGNGHRQLLKSIVSTARVFANASRPYEHIVHLWIRALENCDAGSMDSFLAACEVAERLVQEMIRIDRERRQTGNGDREELRFADVASIFVSLTSIFSTAWESQKNESLEKEHRDNYRRCYQKMVGSITYVIYWLMRTARTIEDRNEARKHVWRLIKNNPKSIPENDTLLHIYALRPEWKGVTDSKSDSRYLQVAKLLLECGARVNARNARGETPFHKACNDAFSDPLNKILVKYGAHLDTPDTYGSTPAHLLSQHRRRNTIDVESHTMTLRCHAARTIVRHEIPCNNLPEPLQEFVDLHRQKTEVE